MAAEVFFAAVAEPDAEDLGDLFSLVRGEALVEGEGTVPFASAGLVFVRVPMATGQADTSAGFLDERQAGEIGVVLFVLLGGHGTRGLSGHSIGPQKRTLFSMTILSMFRSSLGRKPPVSRYSTGDGRLATFWFLERLAGIL